MFFASNLVLLGVRVLGVRIIKGGDLCKQSRTRTQQDPRGICWVNSGTVRARYC